MEKIPIYESCEDDSSKYSISVAILIVATGKYDIFVNPLISSIQKFFLPNNKKIFHIFSEKKWDLGINVEHKFLAIEHHPFPYPTLYRFHFFDRHREKIEGDQIVYIDADTLIKNYIGTEILTDKTVVQHCGFLNRYGSFEKNFLSKTFVREGTGKNYFGGGFYSFGRDSFFDLAKTCKKMIDEDASNGIVPVWHDESALNRYMLDNPPTRILSPSYHYPENKPKIISTWDKPYECRILLLDKNHNEIRGL